MRRLPSLSLFVALLGCPARAPAPDPPGDWDLVPVSIQGRLAEDEPAPDLTAGPIVGADEVVFLHPDVSFWADHLRHVEASRDTEPLTIRLWFTDEGAERVASVIEANPGRRFALLVNGHVVSAPRIAQPLRPDPQIPVTVEVTLPEPESVVLADAVSQTWGPDGVD